MVYLFIFLGLLLSVVGLFIANAIVKKKVKKKELERKEN